MRMILAAMFALFAAAAIPTASDTRPIDGVYAKETKIPGDGWTVIKRFRGGERASVQAAHVGKQPSTTVHITIFDDKGNVAAEDKGRSIPSSDLAAVIWYPPRDAEYRIVIRNTEGIAVSYFVSIR